MRRVPKTVSLEEFNRMIPIFSNWGKWGESDQLGTLNYIDNKAILSAKEEILEGKVISLAIPFDSNGPQKGRFGRFNPIHVMLRDGGDAISGAFRDFYGGKDFQIRGTDDIVIMPLQCATQWDSLAHIIHNGKIYNGYSAAEVTSWGAKKNSIAVAKDKIVGRGVLLDAPKYFKKTWMEPGEELTSEDLEGICKMEGVKVKRGDIVLVRTGQMAMVKANNDWGDYAGGPAPGLGLDTLYWIKQHEIAAIATDTWGVEVRPNPTPDVYQPFHIIAIVYMGLLLGEIFDLEELSKSCEKDGRYTFFFSAPPLPITGAVGSPINPIAIK